MSNDYNNLPLEVLAETERSSCKGVIYKADIQHCKTKRGVLFSVRLNKMKRMSCQGCDDCDWLDDELNELDHEWYRIVGIEKVENGELYQLQVGNIGTDWETGIVDEWELCLSKVKEGDNE